MKTAKFFKTFFLCLGLFLSAPLRAEQPAQQTPTTWQNLKVVLSALKAHDKTKLAEFNKLPKIERAKIILYKVFIKYYGRKFFKTLCHEFGHAICAKILWNAPLDIHIGATAKTYNEQNYKQKKPLLTLGGITINGIVPDIGFCYPGTPKNTDIYAQQKEIGMFLAGGFFGALGNMFYGKILDKTATLKELATDPNSIAEIVRNILIPFNTNDAARIWKKLHITPPKCCNHLNILAAYGIKIYNLYRTCDNYINHEGGKRKLKNCESDPLDILVELIGDFVLSKLI